MSHVCPEIFIGNVSIGKWTMETAYSSGPAIQSNDPDDEEVVVEAIESEPVGDTSTIANFASLDECVNIVIQANSDNE